MTIYLPDEKGSFELTPAGSHVAVCYRVIDLGTQFNQKFQKQERKIQISWGLPNELMSDGRPFTQHQRYTLSASKKSNLRPDLESWRGVPFTEEDFGKFDLGKLIGVPCMLGIVHNVSDGNTYANISSIMRLPKGMPTPTLAGEPLYFSLADFDQDKFSKLSEGLQAVIAKSPEYQELKGGHAEYASVPDDSHRGTKLDDEIPF